MTPQLKFTITEPTVDPTGVDITEPIGWNDITLSLSRSDYHSLVENFEGEFIWAVDAFLKLQEIRDTVGADAKVLLTVGMKTQILGGYSTIFTGLIDISEFEEICKVGEPYKVKAPIANSNLWTTFISRMKTPIDLMATIDLDGNACAAADKITLPLPSQKIFSRYEAEYKESPSFSVTGDWVQFSADLININEVENVHTYPNKTITTSTASASGEMLPRFIAKYKGSYRFVFMYEVSNVSSSGALSSVITPTLGMQLLIGKLGVAFDVFTQTDVVNSNNAANPSFTRYEIDVTYNLIPGDEVRILGDRTSSIPYNTFIVWGKNVVTVGSNTFQIPTGSTGSTELIEASTDFEDTTTESILLKEAFKNILVKTTGIADPLVSNYLDNFTANDLDFAIQKQMHIRGYSFTDKPFTIAFEKCWKGAAPALALGFGYTDDGKFEIEKVDDFYDPTPSLTLSGISEIIKKYDESFYINLLTLGFNKGQGDESKGGLDDVQTVKNWRTIFARIGKGLVNKSDFYAAALGMEQARRNRAELTKDFKNDEEVCIISVKADGSDWTPELGEDFVEVTNVINSDSRYNCRLFVSRIFKRWQNFYENCLFQTAGGTFYFVDGEGNFKATVKLQPGDIEEQPEDAVDGIAENADFEKSADNLIIPYKYNVSGTMTYDQYTTIKNNRKKAVVIPYDGVNQLMFIRELRFKLMKGTFTGEFFGGGEA